jgi:predicted unusual protein kinase regulating ubiquinone biosynthesis (AarF/ABC1/UbiB family)
MQLTRAHLRRYRDICGLVWRHRTLGTGPTDDAADPHHADELAHDLEKLGPTFVKLGQLLSTRPDMLPLEYVKALSRLQDDVKPFDTRVLAQIVRDELQMDVSEAFASLDEKPLAAASLGQVHRARLHDGRDVVVKVQRPGIREQVLDDMKAFENVAEMLDKHTEAGRTYEFGLMLEELRASLLRELDYETEAKNLVWLHDTLETFPQLIVPLPIANRTTPRVLTMEYVAGTKITALATDALAKVDGDYLADEVFRAYLKQILVEGVFHADPHPGNVLLTDDGRIALIDLGMVAYLSPTWRDGLFRLLLSLAEGRSDEVADVCLELSDVREEFDERVFRRRTTQIVASQQNVSVEKVNVGRLVVEIAHAATASGMRVPAELTMLGKTLLNLDQVGRTLSPQFKPNQAIRRHANELMQQRIKQQVSPAHMLHRALEVNDLVQRIPTRANRVLDSLARNRFKLTVDVIDETVIVDGMQKVANRIATGIILAALILGSAMMMRVETSFRIFGMPGFAFLFFLAAGLGGVLLVLDILVRDRFRSKPRRLAHS